MKSSSRHGFTLIEVMLYLAIAGALAVGIIAASGPSLARQRYNSGVQTFQDFLEGLYASVNSVQNISGNGRSGTVIYGKFITFGEPDATGSPDSYENTFHIYDIIGDVYDPSNSTASGVTGALMDVNVCLYRATVSVPGGTEEVNYCSYEHADLIPDTDIHFVNHDTFTSRLSVENALGSRSHTPASGAIMIVRSPTSGVISTFVTSGFDFSPDNYWDNDDSAIDTPAAVLSSHHIDTDYLTNFLDSRLRRDSIDFCLYSEDMHYATGTRRDVRLVSGASNSSGIILLPADDIIALGDGDGSAIKTNEDYPRKSICQN